VVEVNKYFKIINLAFALSFVLCSHVKNYSYALEHNHSVTDFKLKKNVADLVFEGLERTKEPWLRSYINIDFPSELSLSDLDEIRSKILTTGVFHRAEVIFVEAKGKTYARIRVSEKWTTIPVVRAEVGGGTPLYVAGIYDQHSFGRLLTLGSEFRKYGDENPGFVMWFKSPRHAGGKYNLGIELWNEIRKRTFYDNLGNEEALFTDRKKRVRAYFLSESSFVLVKGFKIGL
jgi:hypothetical protein